MGIIIAALLGALLLPVAPARASTYADKILARAPIGYWQLDENSGSVAFDSSGNGRHATYYGVSLASTTSPTGSNAATWDGVNDYVALPASIATAVSGLSTFTVSIWVKVANWTDGVGRSAMALSHSSGYALNSSINIGKRATDNTIGCDHTPGLPTISKNSTDTGYVHLAYVFASGIGSFYVDGAFINNSIESSLSTIGIARIGYLDGGLGSSYMASYWAGSIAQVAIFSAALSDADILDLSDPNPPPTPTPTNTNTPTATFTPTPTLTRTPVPTGFVTGSGREVVMQYTKTAGDWDISLLMLVQVGLLAALIWLTMARRAR